MPLSNQFFNHVTQTNHVFHAYSPDEARHFFFSSVGFELAELADVQRRSVDSTDQLASPIAQFCSTFSPETSQALDLYLPPRTADLF